MNASVIEAGGRTQAPATAGVPGFSVLAGAVFLAPYLSWRPFEIMFTASDALFCIALAMLGVAGRLHNHPWGPLTPFWLASFAVMVTGLLIGSIVNGEPIRWAITSAQYAFGYLVLPFLLVGHGVLRTELLARALVAGVAAMEMFGIGVYYLYDGSFDDYRKIGFDFISGSKRLGAFLSDANWNGVVLATTMPFVLYLWRKGAFGGWLAAALLVLFFQAIILTASVSALACALAGVGIMVVVGRARPPLWLVAAGVFGILGYFATGNQLPEAFSARILPALTSGNLAEAGTFSGRLTLMHEAWQMIGDTMVVGVGVDQYRVVSELGAPVHNMYLLLWAEGGLPALVGWLGMMMVMLASSLQVLRHDRATGALGLAVSVVFLVSSTASPHMVARLWMVPVLLAMGFVFAVQNSRHHAPDTAANKAERRDAYAG